ncbi:hypothetical protein [Actinomadura miaoliensis]|uniref:WD40 repeat domain-containing protein n=1 Tax=Actinomadura miaoliensis TaxID=430685 RepID=A0ABP7WM78_9ACTN
MTDDLQQALRNTLRAASLDAPDAAPELLDRVVRRGRARRRNRAMVPVAAAITTAMAVTAGTSFVADTGPGAGAFSGRNAGALPPRTVPSPVPVPKAAILTVPDTLPDGRAYNPEVALDDGSLLVSTSSRDDVPDRLWRYDPRTRQATKVTDVPKPAGPPEITSDFAVGDGQVVWANGAKPGGRSATEIWAAPLRGGKARRVLSMDAASKEAQVGQLVVGGGKLRWSLSPAGADAAADVRGGADGDRQSAVYEAPLAGGSARMIPGTEGYRILSWPWIGTPGTTKGQAGETDFKELRNLETGQTRSIQPPKAPNTWTCWISWCLGGPPIGVTLDRVPDTRILPLAGGTGRALPADKLPVTGLPVMYDRFINRTLHNKHEAVYDLATGKLFDLGPGHEGDVPQTIPSARQNGSGSVLDRYLIRTIKGSFQIVDLAAIG